MSTCGDVGSDVHALIEELAIRRAQHRSETYSNESQRLAEGTKVARLGGDSLLFYSRHSHSACVTISADREWRLRAPDGPIRKARRRYKRIVPGGNRIRGAGRSERGQERGWSRGWERRRQRGRERSWGRGRSGSGSGSWSGSGVEVNEGAQNGNGDGSGDGAGTGTGTGVGIRRRTPDGNGDGNGDGSEDCSGDGNGDGVNGNENRIGEGGGEAKKRKKPPNSCTRRAGNGGDTGRKRIKCGKERVCSVAANPDNLGSNKEAEGGAQGAQGSSRICTSRERVSPLSRLIKGFRNKYH